MKKIVSIMIVLAMCLSLCACGKSSAVKEAEKAIESIGEVTLNSGEAIENAEKLMSILTEKEKEKVDNRLTLLEAREYYDKLIVEMIRDRAKTAYDKLTEAAELSTTGVNDIYGGAYAGILGQKSSNLTMMYYMKNYTSLGAFELTDAYMVLFDKGIRDDSAANGVSVVLIAYDTRGTFNELDTLLGEAHTIIQELISTYSDMTYAPKLQEYYAAVSVCAEFFKSPSGTFNDLESTVKNFSNTITAAQAGTGLLFG